MSETLTEYYDNLERTATEQLLSCPIPYSYGDPTEKEAAWIPKGLTGFQYQSIVNNGGLPWNKTSVIYPKDALSE